MPTTALPKHWKDLVHVDENKTELFGFLSQQVISIICSPAQCDMTNLTHVVTRKQTSCGRCCSERLQRGDYSYC